MTIRTETPAGGIGTLVLASPPLNILTQAMLGELREALGRLAREPALRVLILGAEGPHFSAGADVFEHLPPRFRSMIPEFLDTVLAIAAFPVPVIAAVRGRCLGGGFEVAQAADWIVAGESASFGQPEIRLGVIAPAACALLPRRCLYSRAAELLFTGDALDSSQAREAGLVHCVVPDNRVMDEAMALAARVARHSAAAVRATRRALRLAESGDTGAALSAAGTLYLDELMQTHDAGEGLRAFLDKRAPVWTHE